MRPKRKPFYVHNVMWCNWKMWDLGDNLNHIWTFVKLNPQKTNSESQMGIEPATFWLPVHHLSLGISSPLSLGRSMVGASYWSSEGCGFDFRLGLRNRIQRIKLVHLPFKISPSSHISQTKNRSVRKGKSIFSRATVPLLCPRGS